MYNRLNAAQKTIVVGAFAFLSAAATTLSVQNADDQILSYTVDLNKQELKLFWKDDDGAVLGSIQNLKSYLARKKQTLVFAVNGGMYKKDHSPQGLFVQNQKVLSAIDDTSGNGNFYLKPNGVFYVTTDRRAGISPTEKFNMAKIRYATQSGPMLVIDGQLHPKFHAGSKNFNIRNGVGILPDGKIAFAMSKTKMNLYDFAKYFKKLGCRNALYLDGFVSRTYLPEKNWMQTDGNFGVMIGVSKAD